MDNIWIPGVPMEGDTRHDYGVHAFKNLNDTVEFLRICRYGCGWYGYGLNSIDVNTRYHVLGKVQMWGEVVEHQYGYRASFAKVISLEELYSTTDTPKLTLEMLRDRYIKS